MRRQLKASVRVWPPRESEGSGLDVPRPLTHTLAT